MNVTSINQTSGNLSVNQPKQDSHEKNIEKQIMQLQEKMRSIAYDSEMPAEEKDNEKKSLQEKIQTLNSELKQYQIQKRQEEAEKRQEEAKKRETEAKRQQDAAVRQQKTAEQRQSVSANTDTPASSDQAVSAVSSNTQESAASVGMEQSPPQTGFSDTESDAMISFSNTKEHLASMQKLHTSLEGQMRTAQTDDEKAKIQKKMDSVSKSMGEKIQKIADTINDTQKEEEKRKEKIRENMKKLNERADHIKAVVPKTTGNSDINYGYWQKNGAALGKVLLTKSK